MGLFSRQQKEERLELFAKDYIDALNQFGPNSTEEQELYTSIVAKYPDSEMHDMLKGAKDYMIVSLAKKQ